MKNNAASVVQIQCAECAKDFAPNRAGVKYCSRRCARTREWKARRAGRTRHSAACKQCGKDVPRARCNSLYCGSKCRAEARGRRFPQKSARIIAATGVVGAIQELRVAADLLVRGFEVYRNVTPHGGSDLVIVFGNKLFKIEVTTGNRLVGGGMTHPEKDPAKFDILAVVEHEGQIHYTTAHENMRRFLGDSGAD